LAQANPDQSSGIAAIRTLLDRQQDDLIAESLKSTDQTAQNTVAALGNSTDNRAADLLATLVFDQDEDLEMRRQSLRAMVKLRKGAKRLLQDAESGDLDPRLSDAAALAFSSAPFGDIRDQAAKLYPARAAKDAESLPSIRELLRMSGNAERGMAVYVKTGTCANCHVVAGNGKEVGPDLSQIGSKLSREAMFESIIYPSAGISHNYENFTAVLDDGNVVSGLVTSQTDDEIVMKDAEGVTRTIRRSTLEDLVKQPISLMPADLSKLMTQQEIVDVVDYMMTLKK
jgi:putative heme-binding domain-containing protein